MKKKSKSLKKAESVPEKEQFFVKIAHRVSTHVTREANPDDRWDSDDLEYSHTIDGYSVVQSSSEWDFVLPEKPEGNLYLVCAFYSDGDSFHREDNKLSCVALVKYIEDAEAIAEAIDIDYKRYKDTGSHSYSPLKVLLPISNQTIEISTGTWKGYFETLNSVEVECLSRVVRNKY